MQTLKCLISKSNIGFSFEVQCGFSCVTSLFSQSGIERFSVTSINKGRQFTRKSPIKQRQCRESSFVLRLIFNQFPLLRIECKLLGLQTLLY